MDKETLPHTSPKVVEKKAFSAMPEERHARHADPGTVNFAALEPDLKSFEVHTVTSIPAPAVTTGRNV